MREILFRGKPTEDFNFEEINVQIKKSEFIFGNLIYDENKPYIVGNIVEVCEDYLTLEQWIPVQKETLGQFTGLLDKNGKKIFEGDIVKYIDKPHEWHFFITNQHNKYYGIFQKCIYRNFESVENKLGEKEYVFGDFYDTNEISEFVYVDSKRYEIIGNIHEVKE